MSWFDIIRKWDKKKDMTATEAVYLDDRYEALKLRYNSQVEAFRCANRYIAKLSKENEDFDKKIDDLTIMACDNFLLFKKHRNRAEDLEKDLKLVEANREELKEENETLQKGLAMVFSRSTESLNAVCKEIKRVKEENEELKKERGKVNEKN